MITNINSNLQVHIDIQKNIFHFVDLKVVDSFERLLINLLFLLQGICISIIDFFNRKTHVIANSSSHFEQVAQNFCHKRHYMTPSQNGNHIKLQFTRIFHPIDIQPIGTINCN